MGHLPILQFILKTNGLVVSGKKEELMDRINMFSSYFATVYTDFSDAQLMKRINAAHPYKFHFKTAVSTLEEEHNRLLERHAIFQKEIEENDAYDSMKEYVKNLKMMTKLNARHLKEFESEHPEFKPRSGNVGTHLPMRLLLTSGGGVPLICLPFL